MAPHQAAGEPSAYASAPSYDDGRLNAPAALRNRDALTAALSQVAPPSGRALEIASGTGQHVIRYAPAMPGLQWHPTDPDPVRRASISAWIAAEPSPNIAPPQDLDACAPGWAAQHDPYALICLANLLHLVPKEAARTCLTEMAHALRPGGRAVVYGPFLRDGKTTSEGDAAFDARIRVENPGAGYKDVTWVLDQWRRAGLEPATPQDMPANNLLLTAGKPPRTT
ncbi:DUF938 domain-containing protein [Rhodobacteraceae bacterium N5(2021)]|uniref:DUF938 domain-containing protein n=1 Tax=Gymnodinialimonas phycosphaerae TaxID=2841589 RepID=A0A975YFP1_9RHOB|nr:class I SAM-dependent methyltransferase [Gymnodinialimonas phycosphaerae]MBY4894966.1 DUF938 domain-containing protein [Gymnodinialimonas phycosphaerae]